MSNPDPAGRDWPGILALALALVSVAAFVEFMVVSGPPPKSLAYNPDLLFQIYVAAPLISGAAGVGSIVVAAFALRHASRSLIAAIAGAVAGIVLFFFVTMITASLLSVLRPARPAADSVLTNQWPALVLSPPVIGMGAVLIGAAALLARLKGVSGRRPAIVAMIAAGVVVSFLLFNVAVLNLSGE